MSAKLTLITLALVAGLAISAHAAGIKGRLPADDSQQRLQAVKGPAANRPQQQAYLPPPPPPQALLPVQQQAIKAGPGAVAPVFTALRVAPQQPQIIQQQQQEQIQEPEIVQQQQQQVQVQEEVDPNAAAQDSAPAVIAPARAAAASEEEANPRPEPYAFQYAFNSGDSATSGSSAREEQQDASGRVTGFYTLKGEDGRDRRVDYVADASGFRATISTNEMGTADKDSADVDWQAQSPSEGQLRSAELARQRALANPQPEIQQPIGASSQFSSSKISSPRSKGPSASGSNLSKTNLAPQQQQQVQITQQLQEPFEQIRQTELSTRARKSRHAPFYLYTI